MSQSHILSNMLKIQRCHLWLSLDEKNLKTTTQSHRWQTPHKPTKHCLIKNKGSQIWRGVPEPVSVGFNALAGAELAVRMRCSVGPRSVTICSWFDSSKHCLVWCQARYHTTPAAWCHYHQDTNPMGLPSETQSRTRIRITSEERVVGENFIYWKQPWWDLCIKHFPLCVTKNEEIVQEISLACTEPALILAIRWMQSLCNRRTDEKDDLWVWVLFSI